MSDNLKDIIKSVREKSPQYYDNSLTEKEFDDIMNKFIALDNSSKKEGAKFVKALNLRHKSKLRTKRIIYGITASIAAVAITVSFLINNSNEDKLLIGEVYNRPVIVSDLGHKIDLTKLSHKKIKTKANTDIYFKAKKLELKDTLSTVTENRVIVPKGFTLKFELPDGSCVNLNSNSEIIYSSDYSKEERKILLKKGECFFSVKKDIIPFIVETQGVGVRVYGTEFNINTDKDGVVETTLLSGVVGIKPIGDSTEHILKPNEKAVFNKVDKEIKISTVDATDYSAWTKGKFKCMNEPFNNLITTIANKYNATFKYNNIECKDIIISAVLYHSSTLPEILETIETIVEVKFINEGGKVYTIEKR